MIPIYSADGRRVLGYYSVAAIYENRAHFDIKVNKRGHIKRCRLKDSGSLDMRPSSTIGMDTTEMLAGHQCYALRGILGVK